jgi:phage baseplate assembly protein W
MQFGRIIDVDKLLMELKATANPLTKIGLKNLDIQTFGNDYDLSLSPSLSVSLPVNKLKTSMSADGYEMIYGYEDLVKQNFRNVLLTAPGEKLMDKNFGVGLRMYLFENDSADLRRTLNDRIRKQVKTYINYVKILDLAFSNEIDSFSAIPWGENFLRIKIAYYVDAVQAQDTIDLGLLFNSADVSI